MGDDGIFYEELRRRFTHYQLRRVATICNEPLIEMWELGWGAALTLTPESGLYDAFQCRRTEALAVRTIPPGWNLRRKS